MSYGRTHRRRTPERPARAVGLVAIGVAIGLLPWVLRTRHQAAPEQLTGTITWSDQENRRIVFRAGGNPQSPREFTVAPVHWIGADGRSHTRGYPSCLITDAADGIRLDTRPVRLETVRLSGDDGTDVAVMVHCLS